jgi:hypothetical protein
MNTSIVSKTFSYKKYRDIDMQLVANHIKDSMTDNENFPNPVPALTALEEAIENFSDAFLKIAMGGKVDTLIKNKRRKELENILKELATYVQLTSQGNLAVILSSGFDTHKKAAPVGILPRPESFSLKMGVNKGSVDLSCRVVDRALFYVFEYCAAPADATSVWIQITSTRRKITIENLQSGKEYCFRVAAGRTHPRRVWSNVLTSYVV